MCYEVVVVGLGNILLGDDGVGIHSVKKMVTQDSLPQYIRCIDGGIKSFDALYECGNASNIIVVDAIKGGGKPGTIYKMDIEEWQSVQGISLHNTNFLDALFFTRTFQGIKHNVTVIGMEPKNITPTLELSPLVKRKLNELIQIILCEAKSKSLQNPFEEHKE